jgi:hypothetical protein
MMELFSHLAADIVGNLLILTGLALVIAAIVGGSADSFAAASRFRISCAVIGVAVLAYTYGIYSRHPVRFHRIQTIPAYARQITTPDALPPPSQETAAPPVFTAPAPHPVGQSSQSTQLADLQAPPQPSSQQLQPATDDPFSGKWKNSDPNGRDVVFLKVEEQGSRVSVRAWGMCSGQYCDWGTAEGTIREGAANVSWNQGAAQRRMVLFAEDGRLRMELDSAYRDHRPARHAEEHFTRTP